MRKENDVALIIKLFKTKRELTIAEVVNYLDVSRNTATRRLNELIEQKKVLRIGKGPSVRYVLA